MKNGSLGTPLSLEERQALLIERSRAYAKFPYGEPNHLFFLTIANLAETVEELSRALNARLYPVDMRRLFPRAMAIIGEDTRDDSTPASNAPTPSSDTETSS